MHSGGGQSRERALPGGVVGHGHLDVHSALGVGFERLLDGSRVHLLVVDVQEPLGGLDEADLRLLGAGAPEKVSAVRGGDALARPVGIEGLPHGALVGGDGVDDAEVAA